MTTERALEIVQRLVVREDIRRGVDPREVSEEQLAYQTLHGALARVDGLAALYHEGIESITSRKAHNDWVDSLIDEVEWEPLRDFLERLKESEVGGNCDVRG